MFSQTEKNGTIAKCKRVMNIGIDREQKTDTHKCLHIYTERERESENWIGRGMFGVVVGRGGAEV